jgi:branched-subunit amino acid aminotransferase/4-amino-4-deoxychorismate lyase
MKALGLELEFQLDLVDFKNHISKLSTFYSQFENKRIKILVWRQGKGQYRPNYNQQANYLILIEEARKLQVKEIKSFDVSQTVSLSHTIYSEYKTTNALTYTMAGMEMERKSLDEILIQDSEGNICEASSSNIICIKGNTAILPISNCAVKGIMCDHVISLLGSKGYKIERQNNQIYII